MRGRIALGILVALFSIALGGCLKPPAPPPDRISAALHLALRTTPTKPKQLDPTTFAVRVTNGQGKPVKGASVTIALTMPGMEMGDNTVLTAPAGGKYVGIGRFSMSGTWEATITAIKGKDSARQSFPINVQ